MSLKYEPSSEPLHISAKPCTPPSDSTVADMLEERRVLVEEVRLFIARLSIHLSSIYTPLVHLFTSRPSIHLSSIYALSEHTRLSVYSRSQHARQSVYSLDCPYVRLIARDFLSTLEIPRNTCHLAVAGVIFSRIIQERLRLESIAMDKIRTSIV